MFPFSRLFMLFLLVLPIGNARSQSNVDFSWWNNKHHWDGYTHWTDYLTYAPGYLGPNALPIPTIPIGKIGTQIEIEPQFFTHLQPGELSVNSSYRVLWPLANGKVGIELQHIAAEYYQTDSILRDKRAARYREVQGFSTGDLNITTYISLLRESQWPDVLLRMNLRTASGSDIEDARYTDMPGYFFDISAGKTINTKGGLNVRIYGMAGLYVWQIERHRQNDAPLWGVGSMFTLNSLSFNLEAAGFWGYLNHGDRPIQLRASTHFKMNNNFEFSMFGSKGVNDIFYYTLGFSGTYSFILNNK
jgi:hypothetical protein